ncbi:MAG: hypothetical protein AVDCRST_MAG39-880, partial [uncultured Sphingomonadaceae bacterium]
AHSRRNRGRPALAAAPLRRGGGRNPVPADVARGAARRDLPDRRRAGARRAGGGAARDNVRRRARAGPGDWRRADADPPFGLLLLDAARARAGRGRDGDRLQGAGNPERRERLAAAWSGRARGGRRDARRAAPAWTALAGRAGGRGQAVQRGERLGTGDARPEPGKPRAAAPRAASRLPRLRRAQGAGRAVVGARLGRQAAGGRGGRARHRPARLVRADRPAGRRGWVAGAAGAVREALRALSRSGADAGQRGAVGAAGRGHDAAVQPVRAGTGREEGGGGRTRAGVHAAQQGERTALRRRGTRGRAGGRGGARERDPAGGGVGRASGGGGGGAAAAARAVAGL